MKRQNAIVRLVAGMALAGGGVQYARADSAGAAMLKVSASARTSAMGGTQAVGPMGAEALGANPANIGLGNRRYELVSAYESLLGQAQYAHVAAALKLGPQGSLEGVGLSATRLSVGGLQTADALGNRTGDTFGSSDLALALGGSARVGQHVRAGLSVKGLQSKIGSYSSGLTLAADMGATVSYPQVMGAVSIQNMGQGQKFLGERSPLPTTVRMGIGAPMGPALGIFEIGHQLPDSKTELNLGAEFWVGPLALRGGYRLQTGGSANLAANDQSGAGKYFGAITGGLGLEVGMIRLDYAISPTAADYGLTHRVSLLVRWGKAVGDGDKAQRPVRAKRESASWYRENYWMW